MTGSADLAASRDVDCTRSDAGLGACTGSGIAAGILYDVPTAKFPFSEDVDQRERGRLTRVKIADKKRAKRERFA